MRLAAVDIGSNAIRLQITHVTPYDGQLNFKKVEYVRFPLRLGHDVFNFRKLSPETSGKFVKLMQAFKLMIDLYEVEDYYACATSAMREAENGNEMVHVVKEMTGMEIKIISGKKEAGIINLAINQHLDDTTFIHIDVGGGSTELNIYHEKEKIASKSFNIGTVRNLEHHESPKVWGKMEKWINKKLNTIEVKSIQAIGTGGNINKLFDVAKKRENRNGNSFTLDQLMETRDYIAEFSLKERISFLQLNEDRADVIIPASNIYISVMNWAKAVNMVVPDVGLKDGIMHMLYEKSISKREKEKKQE
ncbi:Ppx/GppA phosphatase family protein [Xanthovirga aplysinae]|uniref:Ppx/GppA phosphatase family protein n=1 Tax=Xanthovirga aplysinae TaxID=2529853 RepID=UPI0012BD4AB6|nr:phosphatase [Xanthovirga aplysinae]MTI32754.1 phosphatase [Xanthovirga aplysinae]